MPEFKDLEKKARRVRETYRKNKSEDRPRTWHDVPHSPTPWRDCGYGVVADDLGRTIFFYQPSHDAEAALRRYSCDPVQPQPFPQVYGDYHYLLCAVNCHEQLLAAAKRLAVLLCKAPKKNAAELDELRTLIARADEHFW